MALSLKELAAQGGKELGAWEDLPTSLAMRELQFIRRPTVRRDADGKILSYTVHDPESWLDGTVDQVLKGTAPPPGPRHILDLIDALVEAHLDLGNENALAGLLEFLREPPDPAATSEEQACLSAGRVRVLLAFRNLNCPAETVSFLELIAKEDADPVARAAACAALVYRDRAENARAWMKTETSERALDAFLVELSRSRSELVYEPADPEDPTGEIWRPISKDQLLFSADIMKLLDRRDLSSDLRGRAAQALGVRCDEQGVIAFLCATAQVEPDASVRQGAILALRGAVPDPAAQDVLLRMLLDPQQGEFRVAAAKAVGTYNNRDAAESLVRVVMSDENGELRLAAASGLIECDGWLSPESRAHLHSWAHQEPDLGLKKFLLLILGEADGADH